MISMRLLFVLLAVSINSMAGNDTPVKTLSKEDLQKYTGTWYETAKVPNSF